MKSRRAEEPKSRGALVLLAVMLGVGTACPAAKNLRGEQLSCACSCSQCQAIDPPFATSCTGRESGKGILTCTDGSKGDLEVCQAACNASRGLGVSVCGGDSCSGLPLGFGGTETCKVDPRFGGATRLPDRNCQPSSIVTMISPSGDATVARVVETPAVSRARLEFDGHAGSFVPRGAITFAGGFCADPPCPIVFQGFELTSAAPFPINGTSVTALRITNSGRMEGVVSADGAITITTPAPFDASARIGADLRSRRAVPRFRLARLSRDTGELRINGEVIVTGDEVGSASFELVARFDDTVPVPVIDAQSPAECGVAITLSAARSFDPDGDAVVAYTWFEDFGDRREQLGTGPSLQRAFQTGLHYVGLHVSDSRGRGDFAVFGLRVVDTQPPVIDSLEVSRACLWPPNHKLTPLLLGSDVITSVRDVCDGVPTIGFARVSSTQPVDGAGDGTTSPDWVVVDENAICLRAERAGPVREGRTYRATVIAVDRAGHSSTGAVEIVVAHDQRPSSRCAPLSPDAFVNDTDPRCAVPVPTPASSPRGSMGCQATGLGASWFPVVLFLMAAWRARRSALQPRFR